METIDRVLSDIEKGHLLHHIHQYQQPNVYHISFTNPYDTLMKIQYDVTIDQLTEDQALELIQFHSAMIKLVPNPTVPIITLHEALWVL